MELKGTVHHIETGGPLAGLRIELWAETRRETKTVASTATDDGGGFHLTVELADVRETMGAPVRNLGLKVYDGDDEVPVEEGANSWRFGVYPEDLDLEVRPPAPPEPEPEPEPEPPPPPPPAVTAREVVTPPPAVTAAPEEQGRRVVGRVVYQTGASLEGLLVRIFHLTLGDRPNLGESRTDADGVYTIPYEHKEEPVDLYARVYDEDMEVIATSSVRFHAEPLEVLDMVVTDPAHRGPSEFARLSEALEPLLEDLDIFDLDAEDVAVMAGKTGLGRDAIGRFVAAQRLSEEADLPAEPLFAVLRAGLPASLRRLLAEDRRRIEAALVDAAERGWISTTVGAGALEFAEQVESALVKATVASQTPGSIGRLLDTVHLDKPRQEVVISTFLGHSGTLEEYWAKLRERSDFDSSAINDLQLTFRLGALTLNHAPMVAAIRRRYAPRYGMELARVDRTGWLELMDTSIDGAVVGTPPDIAGRSDEERRNNYADLLLRQVERAWPTSVVAQALRRESRPADRDLVQFLDDNIDFDFEVHRIKAYLTDSTTVLTRIIDKRGLEGHLLSFQRVFRIAPEVGRFPVMRALLDNGLDSAHAVQASERDAFVARYGQALGGEAVAVEVHRLAQLQAALALTVYAQHARALQPPPMPVLPSLEAAVEASEALAMAVPEYKALFWQGARVAPDSTRSVLSPAAYFVDLLRWLDDRRALEWLRERRPDLLSLPLTEATAHHQLPAIDCLIERLSSLVAPEDAPVQTGTTLATEALLAAPEHVNEGARRVLAEAVYPPSLPWDAGLAETRAFLGHLGVSRAELLRSLKRGTKAADKLELAAEALGWTPASLAIAAGEGPRYDWNYWGYEGAQVQTGSGERAWFQELRRATNFLERSGLSFAELKELLGMKAAVAADIELKSSTGSLDDPDNVTLERPMGADFARLHRVIRLWRGLRWSSATLDQAIATLGKGEVDAELALALADVEQLRRHTGRDVSELLAWWGPLAAGPGAGAEGTLYHRTFLAPAVVGEAAGQFRLDDEGSELRYLTASESPIPLLDAAAVVQAALGLDHEALIAVLGELAREMAAEDGADGDEGDQEDGVGASLEDVDLTLDNLTRLYRLISLARVLDRPVDEAILLRRLLGTDPFAGPADALAFFDSVAVLGLEGDAVWDLAWVLRHGDDVAARVAPGDEEWQELLDGIRTALAGAGSGGGASGAGAGGGAVPVDRGAGEAAAIDAIALGCGLPDWAATPAVKTHLKTPGGQSALSLLMALPRHAAKLSEHAEVARLLVRATKLGWALEALDLDEDWLDWLMRHGRTWKLPSLGALPAKTGDKPIDVATWERLVRFVETDSTLPGDGPSLPRLFATLDESREVFVEALAERISWTVEDVETLADHFELNDAGDFRDAIRWLEFSRAIALIDRTGASVERVLGWIAGEATPALAREVRLAAHASSDREDWWRRERALRTPLRAAERDALVTWLLAQGEAASSARELSGRLLCDVAVAPELTITRLDEAIHAVQRFVERCLRGAEQGVSLSAAEVADWPDTASYEVWRARQELFLFPENELAFDESPWASPLFQRALVELEQGDLDADDAERVVSEYLDGLDEVAELSIVGLFHERRAPGDERAARLHVVGRTRGLPHRHFYRQRLDGRRWTAWEPLDLPVGTEPVLPIALQGRIWLVWPLYSPDDGGAGVWIQLAASERKASGFGPPRLSSDALWSPGGGDRQAELAHAFRTRCDDGEATLECLLLPQLAKSAQELTARRLGTFRVRASGAIRGKADVGFVTRVCPHGMRPAGNGFASVEGGRALWLTSGALDAERELVEATAVQVAVLGETVGPARLAVAHQYGDFASQDAFFVEDEARVFFVERAEAPLSAALHRLMETDQADPSAVGHVADATLVAHKPPELEDPTTSGIPYYVDLPAVAPGTEASAERPLSVPDEGSLAVGRQLLLDTHRILSAFEREEGDPFWFRGLRGRYSFALFSHPFASLILRAVAADGVSGVLDPPRGGDTELRRQQATYRFFRRVYLPEAVERPHPEEALRFAIDDANAVYNWELFVLLPLAVATALSGAGEYGLADVWFRVVFDPRSRDADVPVPQRFWRAKPLMGAGNAPLEQFLRLLGEARDPVTRRRLEDRVADWSDDPNDAHALANLRSQTWRLAVVMAYLDHLLAWAADLVEDGSPSALGRAAGLYELASEILGPRPAVEAVSGEAVSFDTLVEQRSDGLAGVLVAVENLVGVRRRAAPDRPERLPSLGPLGPFDVPLNPRLLRYWDAVAEGEARARSAGSAP